MACSALSRFRIQCGGFAPSSLAVISVAAATKETHCTPTCSRAPSGRSICLRLAMSSVLDIQCSYSTCIAWPWNHRSIGSKCTSTSWHWIEIDGDWVLMYIDTRSKLHRSINKSRNNGKGYNILLQYFSMMILSLFLYKFVIVLR